MTNNHLSDEILQVFLLEETQSDTVTSHLSTCVECREKLENYHSLVDNIKKITPETFAFDVTTLVMGNIVQYETKKIRNQEVIFWGFLILLLGVISSFAIPYIPKILSVFKSIPSFTTILIVGTGLMVMLFLIADLNNQYKLKEKKIFENNLQPIF